MDLDRAIQLSPDNANYLQARGYLHQQQGNRHSARVDFERAARLTNSN
jgi:Flp pilus assembly protein TadD